MVVIVWNGVVVEFISNLVVVVMVGAKDAIGGLRGRAGGVLRLKLNRKLRH